MKNVCKKALGVLLNILVIIAIIIVILTIYCLIQIKLLNKDYANLFGYAFFEIGTGSMADKLNIGDGVIVKLTQTAEVGDIIVFKEENNYITHRVVDKNGNTIVTKGDANNTEDNPINISQICGKVVKVIPNIASVKATVSSNIVLFLILISLILVGIFIFYNPKKAGGNTNAK